MKAFFFAIAIALSFSQAQAAPYRFGPLRVEYDSDCNRYQPELDRALRAALGRLESCVNYAFVKPELAQALARVILAGPRVRIRCEEPPRATWCAAAAGGEIWFSPSRILAPGSFCHPDLGQYFVHEIGHLAGLVVAPGHDDMETQLPDQIYSLQNYCMRPARNWLQRSTRTDDVVDPPSLKCMRWYQEQTPTTLIDPFWEAYRAQMARGLDPCR